MILRTYNLLVVLCALIALPVVALLCLFRPTWRHRLLERLGVGWPSAAGTDLLWAHAASVGEVEGIAPLVQRWRRAHPAGQVVVSALTATGCARARDLLPEAEVRAFPLDLPGIAGSVVRRLRPKLFLFSENEVWPNVVFSLAQLGVPIVQVSGRLSGGTASLLARFPRFSRGVLEQVTRFCVQSDAHRERLLKLGVDPARVTVTGSLKGDGGVTQAPFFLEPLGGLGRPVIVAGSTHEGEEEVVITAARLLAVRRPPPFWILAPRHPERFAAVAEMVSRSGIAAVRRSALPTNAESVRQALAAVDLLLLDTIGELGGCFAGAATTFLGGSIAPVGGHNLLEPARAGVPIAVGPHLESVAELAGRLAAVGALTIVKDAQGLADALAAHLDPTLDAQARSAARQVADELTGSVERTWDCVVAAEAETART